MNSLFSRSSSDGVGVSVGAGVGAGVANNNNDNNDDNNNKLPVDVADTGVADIGPSQQPDSTGVRPLLQRGPQAQAPTPPPFSAQPPDSSTQGAPSSAANASPNSPPPPSDSLSLAQLRRIVAEFPRTEPIAYDYVYTDTGATAEEVDEWFVYQFRQWLRLNAAQHAFEWQWDRDFGRQRWAAADPAARERFVAESLRAFASHDHAKRSAAVGRVLYIVLGRWGDTAGGAAPPTVRDPRIRSAATPAQLQAMKEGVQLVGRVHGFATVWRSLTRAFESIWPINAAAGNSGGHQESQDELMNLMTIVYMAIQEAFDNPRELAAVHDQLAGLQPGLVDFLAQVTARQRWDEGPNTLPQTQVFLLLWKSMLLVFGGAKELAETKKATGETVRRRGDHDRDDHDDENDDDDKGDASKNGDMITASPLDYHVFRQEVISKYPAYIPPQPALALEAEHTSLLPPLPHQQARNNGGAGGVLPALPNAPAGGASILHQPVHIATPAPSPPPSPGIGGKGGKKQNYQTNQNFPFMYPPLDASSNTLQESLVGRRWEGSDIPHSIFEAGELFATRVRMTRPTRQLWEEREKFLKFERGWKWEAAAAADGDLIDELDLASLTLEEKEELGLVKKSSAATAHHDRMGVDVEEERKRAQDDDDDDDHEHEIDLGPDKGRDTDDARLRQRLEAVESFYRHCLPQLQSLVIVLLKAILATVTNLMMQNTNAQAGAAGMLPTRPNGAPGGPRGQDGSNGINGGDTGKAEIPTSPSDDEVDAVRAREIAAKAVTGILILLLKWLKVSHVLKFEYLTQLLLDSNYLPLVLKLFALHDVQQVVESKTDRLENSFFFFCSERASAGHMGTHNVTELDEDSEDDAIPPPIKRRRSPPPRPPPSGSGPAAAMEPGGFSSMAGAAPATRPEVDELGYPVNPLPKEPITDFSRRNFFSLINYLRIMHKICKGKAHRNLLLMHYKSSNILRKSLRVPQQELRLYTLKLFKSQVPYSTRKWRQGNMRIITAVYLHCRPALRDEWLAGGDVDADIEDALPLEQALRSLTHWFNVRRYPDAMGPEVAAALREERDFFIRELERLDVNWAEGAGDESVAGGDWEAEAGPAGGGMPSWG